MQFIATAKYVRVSPRKARMVADAVKKYSPGIALEKLQFMAQSAGRPIQKTLNSAIANSKLKPEELKIKNILIDEGVKMKRRAKGRKFASAFGPGVVNKPTSHIRVILEN